MLKGFVLKGLVLKGFGVKGFSVKGFGVKGLGVEVWNLKLLRSSLRCHREKSDSGRGTTQLKKLYLSGIWRRKLHFSQMTCSI